MARKMTKAELRESTIERLMAVVLLVAAVAAIGLGYAAFGIAIVIIVGSFSISNAIDRLAFLHHQEQP